MKDVFIGTDSGATTCKTSGVYDDGTPISLKLSQSSTDSHLGASAMIKGWIKGADDFLSENGFTWDQVKGVGLAMPGPFQRYGVLDRTPNLPPSLAGWEFHADYSRALERKAGRPIPLVTGNDGNYGGVAEAAGVRGNTNASVILLAPGSGLGAAYVGPDGLPLDGDTFAGMEAGHMPAPLHLLGLPPFICGCGRSWGCFEAYTAIAGLTQYLDVLLPKYPNHEFLRSPLSPREKALSLRSLAQKGDLLALEIFDYQAKALGLHIANLMMALDARFVVIGGGLIDPHSTTPEFRQRYFSEIRSAAEPWLYPMQRTSVKILPATLGELSQAIGAALVALYSSQKAGADQ